MALHGTATEGGRERIYEHLAKGNSRKEDIAYIKKEYGQSGRTIDLQDGTSGFWQTTRNGIELQRRIKGVAGPEVTEFTWSQILDAISDEMNTGRYLLGIPKKMIETTFAKSGSVFYTKCGHQFYKSTKAETTGYRFDESPFAKANLSCDKCHFVVSKGAYYAKGEYRECRAGSLPPNHNTEIAPWNVDTNGVHIYGLNVSELNKIMSLAKYLNGMEGAFYLSEDRADCRKILSVSFVKNSAGMNAKIKMIKTFFPEDPKAKELITLRDFIAKRNLKVQPEDVEKYSDFYLKESDYENGEIRLQGVKRVIKLV